MADVFISYKSERRNAARHLQKVLKLNGFEAWYDYGLIPGDDFEPRLMGELRAAKVCVVLWCAMSVKSPWVIKEAAEARSRGAFLPTWIEKASLPKEFAGADTIDLTSWDGDPTSAVLFRLLADVGRRVGREPSPNFSGLRELHDDWIGFGKPSLASFTLGAPVAAHERAVAGHVQTPPLPPPPSVPSTQRSTLVRAPEMVTIPPGRFLMGAPAGEEGSSDAERPQHDVRIDYAFALGKHAVTFAEWDAAIAAGAKLEKPSDEGWGRDRRPVINVNWNDVKAYIAWLNSRLGLEGRRDAYRLPSEAEWEYACRAGTTTPFSFGATISTTQANYCGEYTYGAGKKGENREKTTPVGSFSANAFGLHDMHGNVWEWCEDAWNANYNGAPTDGSAWLTVDASSRVLRGGSWSIDPQDLRSAARGRYDPTVRVSIIGFRVARTV